MSLLKKLVPVALVGGAAFCVSGGSAQDDTLGDLGLRVRRENVDSYWLNSKTWAEYGYREHVSSHLTPFTSLPSVFAGRNYYAYGMNPAVGDLKESRGTLNKEEMQMTKYGTWH